MAESAKKRFEELRVGEVLRSQPGLQLRPMVNGELRIVGSLAFSADAPRRERICDEYEIELSVPMAFPGEPVVVRETGGRVPRNFHTNRDGTLCLGSPTQLRLALLRAPTVKGFIDRCVIPYLYGFSYWKQHGELPFGELAHGSMGLRRDFAELFGVKDEALAVKLVRLGSRKKRIANKQPCPCGTRRRLGRCHHLAVNRIRDELGRKWLRTAYPNL
jgi:hypothetical protein